MAQGASRSIWLNAEHAGNISMTPWTRGPEKFFEQISFFSCPQLRRLHEAAQILLQIAVLLTHFAVQNLHGPADWCVQNEKGIRAGFCPFKNFSRPV